MSNTMIVRTDRLAGQYYDNSINGYNFYDRLYIVENITHRVCGKTWGFKNRKEAEAAIPLHEKVCPNVIQSWVICPIVALDPQHYRELQ